MRLRTFRSRLMAWNIVTLTVTVLACGGALAYFNVNRLAGAIDEELRNRAMQTARRGPPPGMGAGGGGGGGAGGGGGGGGVGGGGGFRGGPLNSPPEGQRPINPPAGQFQELFPEAQAAADLRRPRFFGRDLQPVGGFVGDRPFDQSALTNGPAGQPRYSTITFNGERVRVLTAPWIRDGEVIGIVQIARELRDHDLLIRSQALVLLLFIPLAIAAAAGGAWLMTNRALRPVADVTTAASEITHSDLGRRLPVDGEDELAQMSKTFNEMLERLDLSFKERENAYRELERAYENQKRFLADASHELRTPLARVQLAASNALDPASTDPERVKALEVADKASAGMSRIVQQLLTLSRADAGQLDLRKSATDLRLVVADALEDVTIPILRTSFPNDRIEAVVDADQLRRVFVNLLENATRHTPADHDISVSLTQDGEEAVVEVKDSGEGIAPEHLKHVFDRFYRADFARTDGGTGLGLAICRSIVEAHGGSIEIKSTLGEGTTATVRLPIG